MAIWPTSPPRKGIHAPAILTATLFLMGSLVWSAAHAESAWTAVGGSVVALGDADVGQAATALPATYCYVDGNGDGGPDAQEAAVVHLGGDCAVVATGDVDLLGCYCRISGASPLLGQALAGLSFLGGEAYMDANADLVYGMGDPSYLDVDASGSVSLGDLRLTAFGGLRAGRWVGAADGDVAAALADGPQSEACFVDHDGDGAPDLAERLYSQAACEAVSVGDLRLASTGGGSGGGGGTGSPPTTSDSGTTTGVDPTACRSGLPPTLVGTPGRDHLVGTDGPDIIHGMAGDDLIEGLGGDDELCGGPGKDRLLGGSGDDYLIGDQVRAGEAGFDKAFADTLDGGPGSDILLGETVQAWAATGPYTFRAADDVLVDREGDGQWLVGESMDANTLAFPAALIGGNDRITLGGSGTATGDLFRGGLGPDRFQGGRDRIAVADGHGEVFVRGDDAWGGVGADELRGGADTIDVAGTAFSQLAAFGDFLDGSSGDDLLAGGKDRITLGAEGHAHGDWMAGGDGADELVGAPDVLAGPGWAYGETADGEGGDDVLLGGNDELAGTGLDGDNLDGGDGNDTLSGGRDRLTLTGPGFARGDRLMGGAGSDVLAGGADRLAGSSGDDVLLGDWLADRSADGSDHLVGGKDQARGGAGADLIQGDRLCGDGSDLIQAGADHLEGNDGNDVLVGDSFDADGPGEAVATGAPDRVLGGAGDDVVVGDSIDGELEGDAPWVDHDGDGLVGNALQAATVGKDRVEGGPGDDEVYAVRTMGAPASLTVLGTTAKGGAGNDWVASLWTLHEGWLIDGPGLDLLQGEAGDDGLACALPGLDKADGGPGFDEAFACTSPRNVEVHST